MVHSTHLFLLILFSDKHHYSNSLIAEKVIKMNELCSDKSRAFKLNEINKVKHYFESEIK